jgi:hypothetical protein
MGKPEIIKLLGTACLDEENLMQRGSIGQSVGVIITDIPKAQEHLCEIATDESLPYEIRLAALILAGEFGLQTVISHVAWNLDRVDWGEAREAAEWLANEIHIEFVELDLSGKIDVHGVDSNEVADTLSEMSFPVMMLNERIISRIFSDTKNPVVRLEAIRALDRIAEYRFPPGEYMDNLF